MIRSQFRWLFALTAVLILWSTGFAGDANEGNAILKNVISRAQGIKDYTVSIKVHLDVPAIKSPDIEGTLYYKTPDKVKLDSKKLLFFPKEAAFNPARFDPAKFDCTVESRFKNNNQEFARLKLIPTDRRGRLQVYHVTVNLNQMAVTEITTEPMESKEIRAEIVNTTVQNFAVPSSIIVRINPNDTTTTAEPTTPNDQMGMRRRWASLKGTITVTYSNWRLNTGLKDELFDTGNQIK